MSKVKKILCIYPEPAELRIGALLNRQGIVADLTEVSRSETLSSALQQPHWWDLILCDASAYLYPEVTSALDSVRDKLDAPVVLLRAPNVHLSPADAYRRGAVDAVDREDTEHLLMICEREIRNSVIRKQLRELRYSGAVFDPELKGAVTIATIKDLSRSVRDRLDESADSVDSGLDVRARILDQNRLKSLIDAGGLTLEYQPIVSFKSDLDHRNMFETLVRLKDESERLLMPDVFLPTLAEAGLMDKIDLWIFRQAFSVLEQMQSGGAPDTILFVNVATETLRSEMTVRALGTFASAAHMAPGSIVVEVRKAAFIEAQEGLARLADMLQTRQHGLLIEDPKLDDCAFLEANSGIITHVKLSRETIQGLVEGTASQGALNAFVRCAHKQGIRVIALAVEDADLMPMLFAAGIDAIQGNFMSMPNRDLVYPSVQRIDTGATGVVQGHEGD
ncbi:EAL domain-containing protein [Imhoffiella purpurea]|uniref:Diguanylate cyclase/phosphodiesterase with PAS/PAC sensor(S) n=1 Tax=Imhoffiella purpurea TaxID=1249627 RepID=W9VHR3_9GAMM|nr:EAL domain-containing protein [Imhoffiella purpurea]EXJ16541.1 diguanylate cyclase/phosphodiesterase with PAS/PAC sensor(s) [Imhoffiella purpurea]